MPSAPISSNEKERLDALRRARLLDTLPERVFDDLAQIVSAICGTPIGLVTLVDERRQWFKARVGLEERETSREVAFCAYTILHEEGLEVSDATMDPRFADNPLVTGSMHLRFYAGVPLRDPDGHALGAVCALDMRPRTLTPEQRRALQALSRQAADALKLRATARALEQARWQLEDLLEHTRMLVQIVREDGTFHFVNRSWREALGYSEAQLSSLKFADVVAVEEQPRVAGLLGAEGAEAQREVELRLVTREGQPLTVAGSFIHRAGHGDEGSMTLGLLRDVTELREVEGLKRDFVSTVSHELRTPLTSIRGALGLLRGGVVGPLPEEVRGLVGIAHSNAERLILLVNDILDIEKLDAGRMELTLREVRPEELVRGALEFIGGMAQEMKVFLQSEVGPCPALKVDPERMVQVLGNLLSNAVKFSPVGAAVRLVVRTTEQGQVRFEIQDKGPGIPQSRQALLFQRFRQLESVDTRKRGGTGLGLAISRALVEQHGGRIGVESTPGVGSTFWVELPPAAPSAQLGEDPIVLATRNGALASRVCRLLREEGYRMVQTGSAGETEAQLEHLRPAAVMIDVELAEGAGLEPLERLRGHAELAEVPVVWLTCDESGAPAFPRKVDFVSSPLNPQQLRHALRRLVRRPGAARALVVEDDASLRAILVTQLKALGVECAEAGNGAEAIERAREVQPDLLILDVRMPTLNGFETVEALRQGPLRHVPVLVFTGHEPRPAEREALRLGVTRFLTKSRASEEEVLSEVRALLGEHLSGSSGAQGAKKPGG
ncbi:PAS domain S-box-containing protein [Archangium gephyra]|uniref:histidine kinase n=1 Tax=Archangium gephyra TaxID=48 RepID=A0AAC8TJB1_9BACT|nr:response regulator [Archangium gephyra]AKJ07725.1 diguanylate cyclase/phosphodiesterase [Archangium gephyra]REG29478.1 PAS domain S-box-containing protein [Archangium gephyra]